MLAEILSLFLDDVRSLASELGRAVTEGSDREPARIGHALKGAAANVGALGLSDLGARLQGADQAAVPGLHRELVETLGVLETALGHRIG